MTLSVVDYWHTDGSAVALILPFNPGAQAWTGFPYGGGGGVPLSWYDPSFNDSGWSSTVDSSRLMSDLISHDGGLSPGPHGDFTVIPPGMQAITPVGAVAGFEQILWRWRWTPPAGTRIVAYAIWAYYPGYARAMFTFHNSFRFYYPVAQGAGFEGAYILWINGQQGVGLRPTINTGVENLFSFWIWFPVAFNGGDLEGDENVPYFEAPQGMGWHIRTTQSQSSPIVPPVVGPTAITGTGNVGSSFFFGETGAFIGPVEATRVTGWSGESSVFSGGPWNLSQITSASYEFTSSKNGASTIVQGFVARWTTLEWVKANFRSTLVSAWSDDPLATLTCRICTEDTGGLGETLATSTITMSDFPINGPIYFQFDPVLTLVPETRYFVAIDVPVSYATLRQIGWNCYEAPALPYLPVVYGHQEQADDSLLVTAATNAYSKPEMNRFCAPEIVPETGSVWDIAIGGDGIAVAGGTSILSSPGTGLGVGGQRDPNTDLVFPDALGSFPLQSTWYFEERNATIFRVLDTYVDNGDVWTICILGSGWGPVRNGHDAQNINYTWPGTVSPHFTFSGAIGSGAAKRRSDGSFIGLFKVGEVTSPDSQFLGLGVGYQTISGSDQDTAIIGPYVPLMDATETMSVTPVDLIVDSNDITHFFWQTQQFTRNSSGGLSASTANACLWHAAMDIDGNIGPSVQWDNGLGYGGVADPTGGVTIPYSSNNRLIDGIAYGGQRLSATWPSDILATTPNILRMPDVTAEGVPIWAAKGRLVVASGTLFWFTFTFTGIAVAAYNPAAGAWTAAVTWFNSEWPSNPGVGNTPGALSAAWIESRGQIGVVMGIGDTGWFQWYDQPAGGYPEFVPTDSIISVPCGQILDLLPAQVIG